MSATSIEWCDFSINPIRARLGVGDGHYCEKVSPGCKNCYSSRRQPRFRMPQFSEQRSKAEPYFDARKLLQVLKRKKPTKWFWCDMTDMFGDWVPDEWIAACFAAMAATPWHTHQVLTKRADRMRAVVKGLYANDGAALVGAAEELAGRMGWCHAGEDDWKFPLSNVWLGVSAEDQKRADERIPELLQTPAAVRFVSIEPMLCGIDLWQVPLPHDGTPCSLCPECRLVQPANWLDSEPWCVKCEGPLPHLPDWVIVGSESGPGARPMKIEWARSIVDQCVDAGVPVFVKQISNEQDLKGGDPKFWPPGNWPRQFPGGAHV